MTVLASTVKVWVGIGSGVGVGDGVGVSFRIATLRENQPQWDYKLEIGDQMEVRLSADMRNDREYLIDVGDVIAIGFLDNWELSVTRTVRSDGRITAPESGRSICETETVTSADGTPWPLTSRM